MHNLMIEFIIVGVSSLVLTAIFSHFIIPILRAKKVGQSIRAEGPKSHLGKAGTPTMGGIIFIMAILIVLLGISIWYAVKGDQRDLIPLALTMALAVFNGMVGFVDDYCKLIKKQNEGLKAWQKFLLQVVAGALYLVMMRAFGNLDTILHIPFTNKFIDLGIVYYAFALILIVGMVNSVNLTDGIDGLAGSVTLVVASFFACVAFMHPLHANNAALTISSAAIIGAAIGFLFYNLNPAKVFMGDTGSLFFGGAVTGMAFIINEPIIIFIVGGVYVFETLSVMIQVGSFKLRNKRVFRMSPIHHHFQEGGWSENKIVIVFSSVTALLCVIAWFGL